METMDWSTISQIGGTAAVAIVAILTIAKLFGNHITDQTKATQELVSEIKLLREDLKEIVSALLKK